MGARNPSLIQMRHFMADPFAGSGSSPVSASDVFPCVGPASGTALAGSASSDVDPALSSARAT